MNGKFFVKYRMVVYLLVLVLNTVLAIPTRSSIAVGQASSVPIFLGIFPKGWIDQSLVNNELAPLDSWTGKHTTLIGLSADFEDPATYLASQLNVLWNNGYTPYIDLTAGYFSQPSAYAIAAGQKDDALNHWAQVYAAWAVNGKFAFISVLPDMNMEWISYGRDPENYKLAYSRIKQIFSQNQVSNSAVRWVFAPTGWVQLPFEAYYPGDDLVDVIGFSAFNQGLCSVSMDDYWYVPEVAVGFSLREMHDMAPDKPIFITHLGTTAYTASGYSNTAAKDQWLRDTYNDLANDMNVRAVLYYNYPKSSSDCDWSVYSPGQIQYAGYYDAVQDSRYGYLSPSQLHDDNLSHQPGGKLHTNLPLIFTPSVPPVLLGTYTQEWPGSQQVVDAEYHALDTWADERLSIAGIFVDMFSNPVYNIEMQFETLWDNGYTPFVNLTVLANSGISARQIAGGYADDVLHNVAHSYASMVKYTHQMAFIAPLQEMNGDWVSYGMDPTNFKLAYQRVRQIFEEEGVPSESIKWVFAPNGWNAPTSPTFEEYYPGDAYVDILAFSGYNFGYCSANPYPGWKSPTVVFGQYIQRMGVLSPTKPIFIAQTGTTAYTKQGKNTAQKDQWLVDAYTYLADHPSVRAALYYNRWNAECDWSFYQLGGEQYSGFQQGVANPVYGYVSPYAMKGTIFTLP